MKGARLEMFDSLRAPRGLANDVSGSRTQNTSGTLAAWRIHYGWLMVLAFFLQIYAVYGLASGAELVRKTLVVGSYFMLGFAVWSNRRWPGMGLLGLGLSLNFLAIALNGGLMPVAPETMVLAGKTEQLTALATGQWVPASKDVLLPLDSTVLRPFTDVLVYRSAFGGSRIFSLGDVLVILGLFLGVIDQVRAKIISWGPR